MPDLVPLSQAHCTPRKGQEHRLAEASVRELLAQVPEWELAEDGHALVRTFTFSDYYRTMSFVNALAHVAKIAPTLPRNHLIVMNMCGRGDKDIVAVAEHLGVKL